MKSPTNSQNCSFADKRFWKMAAIVIVTTVVMAGVLFFATQKYVLQQAESKIQDLLLSHKGMHQYVQCIMHPALYKYQKMGEIRENFYAPELLSSSFMVRNQHSFYNQERVASGLPELYYKLAAINPRNPLNRADAMEEKLIKMFNQQRDLKEYSEIIKLDDKKYLYVALPFLENQKSCIKCHGNRKDAPLQLQDRYQGQGGFNENAEDIRAIISVRAPLEREFFNTYIIFLTLLAGVIAIMSLFLFNSRLKKVVVKRTKSLEQEVVERQQAEVALLVSEERFRSLFEQASDAFFVHDAADGTIINANISACKGLGYTLEELKKLHVSEIEVSFSPEKVIDISRKVLGGESVISEGRHRRKDGSTFPVEISLGLSRKKAPQLLLAIVRDISDKRAAEMKLAAEKERLAVTLRSIGDGVITTDIAGKVSFLNKVAEKLTGWSNEAAAGKPLSEIFNIINEQTRKPCANPVTKVLESGQIIGLANHTALIAKDGSERSIADSGAPIFDSESRIIGVVLVFRDVTERIKTRKELLKIKKLESIGVLAGGIAHDFNNLLAAILGNISLALTIADSHDEIYELLQESEKASLRAKDLTLQLLTFAKGGEPVKKIAAIDEVIRDSAGFVLRGSPVRCEFKFAKELWPLEIDTGQISQVIQNIILNASQAMPSGGIISVDCSNYCLKPGDFIHLVPGNYLKIVIKDQGIGMSIDMLDKIFDPYFSTKQQGNGLGLAITHSIVNKHDGHIGVSSKLGQGTTFTIYLPAAQGRTKLSQKEVTAPLATGSGRVMIMDDEEMIRALVERALSRIGYEVVSAVDGEEAILLYKESLKEGNPIDLIMMDLTIPGGMGGEEAIKEILKIESQAKVIVCSGYSNDPVMANFREYGFCAAMVKPFKMRELLDVVFKVVSG